VVDIIIIFLKIWNSNFVKMPCHFKIWLLVVVLLLLAADQVRASDEDPAEETPPSDETTPEEGSV